MAATSKSTTTTTAPSKTASSSSSVISNILVVLPMLAIAGISLIVLKGKYDLLSEIIFGEKTHDKSAATTSLSLSLEQKYDEFANMFFNQSNIKEQLSMLASIFVFVFVTVKAVLSLLPSNTIVAPPTTNKNTTATKMATETTTATKKTNK